MDLQLIIIGGCCITAGVPMLLFPRRRRLAAEQRRETRIAELDAGAEERFFEERRTFVAYPLAGTDRGWRVRGMLLIIAGATLLAFSWFR